MDTSKNGKTVLLVEDDALLALTLTHKLEESGYTVIVAHNGEQGLDLFLKEQPDAVILDIMMPQKDGVEMLEELSAHNLNTTIPIIVLTNANDMDYVSRATVAGVSAYLLKSDRQIESVVRMLDEKIGITRKPQES